MFCFVVFFIKITSELEKERLKKNCEGVWLIWIGKCRRKLIVQRKLQEEEEVEEKRVFIRGVT